MNDLCLLSAIVAGAIVIGILLWKRKALWSLVTKKYSVLAPLIEHIKRHPFGSKVVIATIIAITIAVFTFEERETVHYKGIMFELSKLALSAIFVTILLAANQFVPFVREALNKFFTEKPYLDTLKQSELEKLIDHINNSTKSSYSILNNTREKASIVLAREKAIDDNFPYFLRRSTIIKAVYEEGLEMTVTHNEVEMLQDGYFMPTYTITTNKPTPDFPKFIKFLEGNDRFNDYLFRAKITKYDDQRGMDPTGFKLFEIDLKSTEQYDKEILEKSILIDQIDIKKIQLKTNGEFKKGDIFTYETVNSNPGERLDGNEMPELSFLKPAGTRTLIVQGQHFLTPHNVGLKGGTLYIGDKKADADDYCKPSENIFYKKYKWVLYYDEVSKHTNQKVSLRLIR